jgi:hypothetical protein
MLGEAPAVSLAAKAGNPMMQVLKKCYSYRGNATGAGIDGMTTCFPGKVHQ